MNKTTNRKSFLLILLIIVVLAAIALLIYLALQQPRSSITPDTSGPNLINAQVIPDHAVLVSLVSGSVIEYTPGEVTILVAGGAVRAPGSITIIAREADLFPEAGEPGWHRPLVVNVDFFNINGQLVIDKSFFAPIEVCFTLDAVSFEQAIAHPNDYQVQFYSETAEPPVWEQLQTNRLEETRQLCGVADHLSLFALAVRDGQPSPATPQGTQEGPYEP